MKTLSKTSTDMTSFSEFTAKHSDFLSISDVTTNYTDVITISNNFTTLYDDDTEVPYEILYDIGYGLQKYLLPVIGPPGLLGNILTVLVMAMKRNREISCCVYMGGLAVADSVAVLAVAYYWYLTTIRGAASDVQCQLEIYFAHVGTFAETTGTLQNILSRKLIVTTVELEPYLMPLYIKENGTYIKIYQGFIVDLLFQLSRMLKFDYELVPDPDGKFGHRNSHGLWDGMIGHLQKKKADIAAAPIYITEYREKVVDFTVPFMDIYATLLIRRPPVGVPNPVHSVSDLLNQWEITYGTLHTGILVWYFRNTNDSLIKRLWRNIERSEYESLTKTNEEGIKKVRQEKYAFIIPNSIGEYISNQLPCDLITVDRFLMETGYGFAVPKDSLLLPVLNGALTELKHSGYLQRLYETWWYERTECSKLVNASSIVSSAVKGHSLLFIMLPMILFQLIL